MKDLLSFSYWFDVTPVRMSPAIEIGFFVFFALLIILGSMLRMMRKNKTDKFEKETLRRLAVASTVYGVLGLLWLFFTFEEISYFGMRFWFLVGMIALLISISTVIRYTKFKVPVMRLQEQSKVEANKYLPRSNRR